MLYVFQSSEKSFFVLELSNLKLLNCLVDVYELASFFVKMLDLAWQQVDPFRVRVVD